MNLKFLNLVVLTLYFAGSSVFAGDNHQPKTEADCKEHHGVWDAKTNTCKIEKSDDHGHDHDKDKKKK